ncbi:MAG: VanZ family protein [Clostridium sp.]
MLVSNKKHRRLFWVLFLCYLIVLTYFMFFSDGFGRSGHEGYSYNLTLFKEIKRFYTYRERLGMKSFLINTLGNIVCFMPFGFILPLISRRGGIWYNTFLLSFWLSFCIEVTQIVFQVGSFDVDDMFLNTLGGILGFICVAVVPLFRRKSDETTGGR